MPGLRITFFALMLVNSKRRDLCPEALTLPRACSCQTVFAIAANGTAPGLAAPVQPPVRRRELLQTNMEKFIKIFVACGPTATTPSERHQVAALEKCRHELLRHLWKAI